MMATLLVLLVMSGSAAARNAGEGQRGLLLQVTRLDEDAVAAYSAGDFDRMKKTLTKALALARDDLSDEPIMARVYLLLGVMYVDGLNSRALGVKYFSKARAARADIALPSSMATKAVASAFAESKRPDGRAAPSLPPLPDRCPPRFASRRRLRLAQLDVRVSAS